MDLAASHNGRSLFGRVGGEGVKRGGEDKGGSREKGIKDGRVNEGKCGTVTDVGPRGEGWVGVAYGETRDVNM